MAAEVSKQMSNPSTSDHIVFEPHWRPQAALIRLNRPQKSNALTAASARRFIEFLQDAEDDAATRCVVIRGSKSMFSGGADLEEMASNDPEVTLRLINLMTKLFLAIRTSMLPVVTVVEGPCVGGGYHINLASDYTIATENAWFRHTGVDVGIAPMMPGTMMIPGTIGWKKASSMVLWPRKVPAQEALALGLCSEVVPEIQVDTVLDQRVATLVSRDRIAAALGKAEINAAAGGVFGSSVLSQIAGFLHSREPEVHAKMREYQKNLGSKSPA
jgi:enoyl-CoA hydratase/carnithine racemase